MTREHELELAILRSAQTGGATLDAFSMWADGELRRAGAKSTHRERVAAGRRCVKAGWLAGRRKGGTSQYRDDMIYRLTEAGRDHVKAHPRRPRSA